MKVETKDLISHDSCTDIQGDGEWAPDWPSVDWAQGGPTAMRCLFRDKMGEEVWIPDEIQ